MKCLSGKQYWFWALFNGKDVENRKKRTSHRGPLLIHTSKTVDPDSRAVIENLLGRSIPEDEIVYGAVIGRVDLKDVVKGHPSRWAFEDQYQWIFENPLLFKTPVLWRGFPGLFDVPDEAVEASIREVEPRWYFADEARRVKLGEVLESWKETPYRHWCGVKGAGVDCIHFIVRVLEEMGLPVPKVQRYDRDWHFHDGRELLLEGFRASPRHVEVGYLDPMDGDQILFKFGKRCSHAGFYFEGRLYHACEGYGVLMSDWKDAVWHHRKRYGFRVIEG